MQKLYPNLLVIKQDSANIIVIELIGNVNPIKGIETNCTNEKSHYDSGNGEYRHITKNSKILHYYSCSKKLPCIMNYSSNDTNTLDTKNILPICIKNKHQGSTEYSSRKTKNQASQASCKEAP